MADEVLQPGLCFEHKVVPDLESALVTSGRVECGRSVHAQGRAPAAEGFSKHEPSPRRSRFSSGTVSWPLSSPFRVPASLVTEPSKQ